MVVTLRGFKKSNWQNDKGQTVSGTRLFYEYEEQGSQGICCDNKYFDDNDDKLKLPELQLNHKYDFVYDISIINGKAKATLVEVKKLN